MAILLAGLRGELGEVLIRRLIEQGDEVRVVEEDKELADRWKALGAHIAQGLPDDADLIERAGQNVRTIVVIEVPVRDTTETVAGVLEGAHRLGRTGEGVRVVVVAGRLDEQMLEPVRSSGFDYVALATGRRFGRGKVLPGAIAEAIDAADDLAGNPRLELDLTRPDARAHLRLGGS